MEVIGLDDKSYNINIPKCLIRKPADYASKSKGHKLAAELLRELYPFDCIAQEIYIPGCSTKLYLDLFVPAQKLAIEVQGVQHGTLGYFHKDRFDFARAKRRDREKFDWCVINNIKLVYLDYDNMDNWRGYILNE